MDRRAGLARVELDDEVRLHHDGVRHVRQGWDARELRRHLAVVDLDVIGNVALPALGGLEHQTQILGLVAQLDHVAFLAAIARNVHPAAVDLTWPWEMNWRAANTVGTNLAR